MLLVGRLGKICHSDRFVGVLANSVCDGEIYVSVSYYLAEVEVQSQ